MGQMTGAESLVRTLISAEVNVCFANPGTSEMHFVSALDRIESMRCALGLFEGVVTGAANGYYRMAGPRRRCCTWGRGWQRAFGVQGGSTPASRAIK